MNLGYPIVGDFLYNERDKVPINTAEENLVYTNALQRMIEKDKIPPISANPSSQISYGENWIKVMESQFEKVPHCIYCEIGSEDLTKWNGHRSLFMCLHSYKYQVEDEVFVAELPKWATDTEFMKSYTRGPERRRAYQQGLLKL